MTESPPPRAATGGEARLVAAGALTQLTAQVLGLAVLLVIFTVLARRLALVELGA